MVRMTGMVASAQEENPLLPLEEEEPQREKAFWKSDLHRPHHHIDTAPYPQHSESTVQEAAAALAEGDASPSETSPQRSLFGLRRAVARLHAVAAVAGQKGDETLVKRLLTAAADLEDEINNLLDRHRGRRNNMELH